MPVRVMLGAAMLVPLSLCFNINPNALAPLCLRQRSDFPSVPAASCVTAHWRLRTRASLSPHDWNAPPSRRIARTRLWAADSPTETVQSIGSAPDTVVSQDDYTRALESLRAIRAEKLQAGETVFFDRPAIIEGPECAPEDADKPLLLYLTGMDGMGISAEPQFRDLSRLFEVRRLQVLADDRSNFDELVSFVQAFIEDWQSRSGGRYGKVTVMGESFGGLLASGVALNNQTHLQGMLLANPATSFDQTDWATVGLLLASIPSAFPGSDIRLRNLVQAAPGAEELLKLVPLPVPDKSIGELAYAAAAGGALFTRVLDQKVASTLFSLASRQGGDVVSAAQAGPETLREKLELMSASSLQLLDALLATLPAETVAHRLDACLGLGSRRVQGRLRNFYSPVFYSWDAAQERVIRGLEGIPDKVEGQPVLFIGNHQTLSLDLGLLVSQVYQDKGILMRGLAHPVLFRGAGAAGGGFGAVPGAIPQRGAAAQQESGALGGMPASQTNFFEKFGAVPVSGRNAAKLMRRGDAVLLFPGGVKETIPAAREDKYKLMWPDKAEFVRLAAKYNATIVPFGAVGAAESLSVVASVEELEALRQSPLGKALSPRSARGASQGQAAAWDNNFGGPGGVDPERLKFPPSPLAVPAPLWDMSRMYFYFGKPLTAAELDVSSDEATDATYATVKAEVESCISYLLRKRSSDPYKDLIPRAAYERLNGKQAPSFEP